MTFLDPQERKALVDLIVRYYNMLHCITLFLEKGADGEFEHISDDEYIRIEECMCAIETSIDNIASYIKHSAGAPPSAAMKNTLTDSLQHIYGALDSYRAICEHLTQD